MVVVVGGMIGVGVDDWRWWWTRATTEVARFGLKKKLNDGTP